MPEQPNIKKDFVKEFLFQDGCPECQGTDIYCALCVMSPT
jgi:hypothetical protein